MTLLRLRRTLPAIVLLIRASAAHACTVCDSRNGHQLRAGLFNGHFLHTLLLVAAPVPFFAAGVLLVHFGMPDLPELARESEPATGLASFNTPEPAA